MAYPNKIRVVLFRELDLWVAQCLEVDLVAQGKTLQEAVCELASVVNGRIALFSREGIDPFELPQAPDVYWELFKKSLPIKVNSEEPEDYPELDANFLAFLQERQVRVSQYA
jgi:hypothetical protein